MEDLKRKETRRFWEEKNCGDDRRGTREKDMARE